MRPSGFPVKAYQEDQSPFFEEEKESLCLHQ
jgi:hypothetical protein